MTAPPIRVGVIGRGFWAHAAHIPVLQHLPQYDLTAIASRDPLQARQTAHQFGIDRGYGDPYELIDDPDIDLVAILTPAPSHANLARTAIEAGKDVYVEWPLTTTTAESEALLELAEAAGARHIVGLQRRTGPSIRYARDLVRQGYLGQVRGVRMSVGTGDYGPTRTAAKQWTLDPRNFTHLTSIYGGHFLDTLFHIVGPPRDVDAISAHLPGGTVSGAESERPVDEMMMTGTLDRGGLFQVQLEGAQRFPTGVSIDITGTDGVIRLRNDETYGQVDNTLWGTHDDGSGLARMPVPEHYRAREETGFGQIVADLASVYSAHASNNHVSNNHVSNDPADICVPTFEDAVTVHRIIDAASRPAIVGER